MLVRRFPDLVKLCGGVANILPGTSTVKSDFYILRWEKDPFCKCLSEISLKGFMQANQYKRLEATVAVE